MSNLAEIQYALSHRPNIPKNCGNKLDLLNRSATEREQPLTVRTARSTACYPTAAALACSAS